MSTITDAPVLKKHKKYKKDRARGAKSDGARTMAEWEEHENPFLIEVVIDNISKYLTFEELKVCRGLNQIWKKTTNKTFLKLCSPLHILNDHDLNCSNEQITISQFMEIYSYLEHPHPHAQLLREYRNFKLLCLAQERIPIFYKFMNEVGPQMTSLELVEVQVLRNSQDLMDIVSSKYTPKLEELGIFELQEIDNYQQSDSETVCITGKQNMHLRRLSLINIDNKFPWLDVMFVYPKLKALSLQLINVELLEDIATALVTIRKANKNKLKLTELEIKTVFTISQTEAEEKAGWGRILDLLRTANLPLEKISLDYDTRQICTALIQHYAENLRSVTLQVRIPWPFPLMKALEEMVVEQCSDLTFLTKVPNLQSLCFDPYPQNGVQTRFPEPTPNLLLSLTKLDCGNRQEWNVTDMEKLLLWMPNVQNLKMRFNNTLFCWICENLPNLKELTVWGNDLDDSGVVGDFDGAFFEGCRPNITNLKALERFTMANEAVLNKGLTEKSVFWGFALMPKLSKLTINVKSEFSGTTMRALNRGIKILQVNVASE